MKRAWQRLTPEQKSDFLWALAWAPVIALETYALRTKQHPWTWSAKQRRLAHTDHPIGKALFATVLASLSAWYMHHIVTWRPDDMSTP